MPNSDEPSHNTRGPLVIILAIVAVGILGYSVLGLMSARSRADQLASTNQSLRDSLARLQDQMQSVSNRLENLTEEKAEQQARPRAVAPVAAASSTASSTKSSRPRAKVASAASSGNDARLKQLQSRLAEQQKQIDSGRQDLASTREDVDRTREDLNGRLDSTRDELSGTIAKTHDQLVALENRGERKYFEFQLGKSKQFQRVGSLGLSVRKVDFKHKSYDLSLLVNDQKIDKKHIYLYEPISVRLSEQPVELVVNEIDNNQIKGYVSEPKYKPAVASQTPLSSAVNQ